MEAIKKKTVHKIGGIVAAYFGITLDNLLSQQRKDEIVIARQITQYISLNLIKGITLEEVAEATNKKQHGTIIHAKKVVEISMSKNRRYRYDFNQVYLKVIESFDKNLFDRNHKKKKKLKYLT